MATCRICKKPIPKREGGFYTSYRSSTDTHHEVHWCRACDKKYPKKVEALVDAVERASEEGHRARAAGRNPDDPEIEIIPANQHYPHWRPDMWVVRVDGRLIFHGDRETAKRTAREYIRRNRLRGYQMTFGRNPDLSWHQDAAREYAARMRADAAAGHGDAEDYWTGALAAESRALAVSNPRRPVCDVRDRVERFFEPVIRLRYSARGNLFTIDTLSDRQLARKMGIPSCFSEADYDKWLAQAGRFGVSFETTESNPRRPTREFMQRCMAGVGPGYDPGAVCGSQWYHKMTRAQKAKWLKGERRRRNPDYAKIRGFEPWMAQNPQFVQAVNKFIEFHGVMPQSISKKDMPGLGSARDTQFLVHMGKAMDTTYKPTHKGSSKYGSAYIHEFGEGLGHKPKNADLPDQVCTPDGKNIVTFGGKFEVKDWVRK